MRDFCRLVEALDRTVRTAEKVARLRDYLRTVPAEDAAWGLWFLSGRRMTGLVKTGSLRSWAAEAAGLPGWLVEECYEHVGDLAETLALVLPSAEAADPPRLARLVEEHLLPLAGAREASRRERIREVWGRLDSGQRLVWHKLLTGGFRVGVSRALVVRALADLAGVASSVMMHRLAGDWRPTAASFRGLLGGESSGDEATRPYPFYLASPLEGDPRSLGEVGGWLVEWKWDGIRAQVLRRSGRTALWSRGEEVITEWFPEVAEAARCLEDGTVLDGELLAWSGEGPQGFGELQRRLNRRRVDAALRAAVPVVFMAYDLPEAGGVDLRGRPMAERRERLARVLETAEAERRRRRANGEGGRWVQGEFFAEAAPLVVEPVLRLSPGLGAGSWEDVASWHAQARALGVEGVMLKRKDAPYGTGRERGAWWKWKVDPLTCDAVLVGAQPGHGRRAGLFTDYTFAVWMAGELVPVAKAYSGLTEEEIDEVDAFVRARTIGRHGPMRTVRPELVFELAFDGVSRSTRHRAGWALRFPRIARWRRDKRPADADSVEALRRWAAGDGGPGPDYWATREGSTRRLSTAAGGTGCS